MMMNNFKYYVQTNKQMALYYKKIAQAIKQAVRPVGQERRMRKQKKK